MNSNSARRLPPARETPSRRPRLKRGSRPSSARGFLLNQNSPKVNRDAEYENAAQQWIEEIIEEKFPEGVPYEHALRDGIILCKLIARLQPGLISRINTSGGDYKFMDNINQFHKACTKFGVHDVDMFQTVDLWELKNINNVTKTIYAIGRTCYKHPEFRGPFLGPRPSEENRRAWSEQQLRAGEAVIGLQAGSNKGATQAGLSIGATRKILLGK